MIDISWQIKPRKKYSRKSPLYSHLHDHSLLYTILLRQEPIEQLWWHKVQIAADSLQSGYLLTSSCSLVQCWQQSIQMLICEKFVSCCLQQSISIKAIFKFDFCMTQTLVIMWQRDRHLSHKRTSTPSNYLSLFYGPMS